LNIVDAFLFQARHQPTELALCVPGTQYNAVSYGRLRLFVNNIASRALSAGLRRGSVVAVVTNDPVFHLALVLGLTRIGAVTLSTTSPKLPSELEVDALLTDVPGTFQNVDRMMLVDQSWTTGDGRGPDLPVEPASEYGGGSAPARIVLTSGTTGEPKAVSLSHDMMLRRLQAYDVAFGNVVPTCARVFLDLGLTASFGYTWALHILARGGAIFLRGADAAETLQAFQLYNVQCMISRRLPASRSFSTTTSTRPISSARSRSCWRRAACCRPRCPSACARACARTSWRPTARPRSVRSPPPPRTGLPM
jgi:acyl-CoA synthetase (AMP-forming)/AMP-acid ligase II